MFGDIFNGKHFSDASQLKKSISAKARSEGWCRRLPSLRMKNWFYGIWKKGDLKSKVKND